MFETPKSYLNLRAIARAMGDKMVGAESYDQDAARMDLVLYQVVYGDQLTATVHLDETTHPAVRAADLEIAPVPADSDDKRTDWVVVGKRIVFEKAMQGRPVPDIRDYGEKAAKLYDALKGLSVAKAEAYLVSLPHDNSPQECVQDDMERPEVAIVMGMINGFKDCCIGFYIDTRMHGVPEPEGYLDACRTAPPTSGCSHIPCPSCVGMNLR
jgi:hypothetical protein